MKGVSPLVSHALDLAIIIGAFTLVIVSVSTLKNSAEEQFLNYQVSYVAAKVAEQVSVLDKTFSDSSNAAASLRIPLASSSPIFVTLSNGVVSVRGTTSAGKTLESNRTVTSRFQASGQSKLPATLSLTNQGGNYFLKVSE